MSKKASTSSGSANWSADTYAHHHPAPMEPRPRYVGMQLATVAHTMGSGADPKGDQLPELALEIRRAWLQNDQSALVRALRLLAPYCEYSSRELARVLGISARHLQRIFSGAIGSTPQDWLSEQRLLAAKALLPHASSVKEVAYTLGFRSLSQLTRDFKKHFETTPSSLLTPAPSPPAPASDATDEDSAKPSVQAVDESGRSLIIDNARQL